MYAPTTNSTARPRVTSADLEQAGFTPEQIDRLSALRSCYPAIEFIDSGEQFRRLVFMKWLHESGRLR
jgi:hypothetical protein